MGLMGPIGPKINSCFGGGKGHSKNIPTLISFKTHKNKPQIFFL
jgi:hypothetical protein